jgi:fatty acid-binding protein DegV
VRIVTDSAAEMLRERLDVDGTMEILRISPVLGVHTGPGIAGATVVHLHLMEGLA